MLMFGRRKAKAGKLPKIATVVGKGTVITGNIHFEGGLHVDGKVLGSISADHDEKSTLVLSELGHIEGDIHVPNVVLNGEVQGDVHASNHVELANKASINGTVYYKFLEMMMGAVVNGQLVRASEKKDTAAAPPVEPLARPAVGSDSSKARPRPLAGGARPAEAPAQSRPVAPIARTQPKDAQIAPAAAPARGTEQKQTPRQAVPGPGKGTDS
jgi:cytoskeletal protein CcmA (bactofilin family)